MHLCTISVDRYLSLRYPMKFGRNKSRRRVTLKIVFVWLLSIAMSLPLSLMYSKDQDSVLIDGECQIPDPLYKFIGSIICFYIPLIVMLLTYALTVRLLAQQRQNLGTPDWSSGWLGGPTTALGN
ncbi:7 transmembrane receptor (rhodopsin family) [Popillia japonica]|uniref:7 transmembrane receptor (Rhodopsin family) n=1 Tax=Popillia japonica TaxID=7064 RepID=A0AAW1LDR7_POPJA